MCIQWVYTPVEPANAFVRHACDAPVYYTCDEAAVELQWKAVDFALQLARELPTLRLRVGPRQSDGSLDTSQAAVRVWQSADHALIVAFASALGDRQPLVESAAQNVHVSLAPSPSQCGAATTVTSLHFVFRTTPSPSPWQQQPMAPWQLVQLFPRQCRNAHHLLLTTGATVQVLVFEVVEKRSASRSDGVVSASGGGGASSCWRGQLGVHWFAESTYVRMS